MPDGGPHARLFHSGCRLANHLSYTGMAHSCRLCALQVSPAAALGLLRPEDNQFAAVSKPLVLPLPPLAGMYGSSPLSHSRPKRV